MGPPPSLLALAEQRFGPLSAAETEVFKAAYEGRPASRLAAKAAENDPAHSAKWSAARAVRAECLAWLCTAPEARSFIHYRGVDLRGIKINGDLDLGKAKIELFLTADRCAFLGGIILRYTEARELHFLGCHITGSNGDGNFKALDAEGAKITGSLYFKDGSNAQGEVSLLGATLGGDLDCRNAVFANPGADALSADGVTIEGDILLAGCTTEGTVSLFGATINGDLDCSGAKLRQNGSLNGDGMKIEGDTLLAEGFCADGQVSFAETRILGNLDCTGGQFLDSGDALRLESAHIDGNILLNNFKAEGEVNLRGATVSGSLECRNAQFLNSEDALTADAMKIAGDVTLGEQFIAHGEVRMFRAIIEGDLDCKGAQFVHSEGALSADGAKITGDVKFSGTVKADGQIRFPGATIGGNLDCEETELVRGKPGDGDGDDPDSAFNGEGARIQGTVFFGQGFVVKGRVSLIGATIAGDLEFGGADFRAQGSVVVSADRASIAGDVLFRDGFHAEGELVFLGAMIGGDIDCEDAQFSNPTNDALSAESAKIEGSVTLHKSLKLEGSFNLENAEVHHRLHLGGFSIPKKATIDLRSATVGAVHGDEANPKSTGHLLLDGFTYGRFHIDDPDHAESWIGWLQQQRGEQFAPQPYEQLAAVLREMGYERDARRVMIAKNRHRARSTPFLGQGWWWYNVFGWFIRYGYAPWRAFALSGVMIVIGFLLFSGGYDGGLIIPTKEIGYKKNADGTFAENSMKQREISEQYPVFSPLVYSVESFTPLLKLDQSANWAPDANGTAGRVLRYYLYLHVALGWLLTSLWVGAITGLVKS